jgi:intracellular sulfur oxidation DsrE/DsrF family protein
VHRSTAVAPRLPILLLTLACCITARGGVADGIATAEAAPEATGSGLIADIVVHTPDAVLDVLERLDELASRADGFPAHEPVVMVLHGDEAETFRRSNYLMYKEAVDRAARLEAFGLLDVRVCERWMRDEGVMQSDLPFFVDTVPDGAAEALRLERAGYVRF